MGVIVVLVLENIEIIDRLFEEVSEHEFFVFEIEHAYASLRTRDVFVQVSHLAPPPPRQLH